MAIPRSRPIKSPRDAEMRAEEWMQYFGYRDAAVTQKGADRGIDVMSAEAVAQVKLFTKSKVGRPAIQMLKGAAQGKVALFFSSSGYSAPAVDWANSERIALFVFDSWGNVQAVNKHAERIERAAQNLGPPLDDEQRLKAKLAAYLIGILIALPMFWIGSSQLLTNPEGCFPLINASSAACDRPYAGPLILMMFGVGLGGLCWAFLPEGLEEIWQDRIDKRWKADHKAAGDR